MERAEEWETFVRCFISVSLPEPPTPLVSVLDFLPGIPPVALGSGGFKTRSSGKRMVTSTRSPADGTDAGSSTSIFGAKTSPPSPLISVLLRVSCLERFGRDDW